MLIFPTQNSAFLSKVSKWRFVPMSTSEYVYVNLYHLVYSCERVGGGG